MVEGGGHPLGVGSFFPVWAREGGGHEAREAARNRWENLAHLKNTDEVKFVIGTQEDYEWSREQVANHELASICPILFSWVTPLQPHQQDKSLKKVPAGQTLISRQELVEKIIADALPVRFQLQMHKFVWPPDQRRV